MRITLLAAFVAFSITAVAQQARVQRFSAPLSGTVNLGQVDDKYAAEVFSLEAPPPDGNIDKIRLREAKEKSAARFPRKEAGYSHKTTAAAPPILGISYVADSVPGIPPDNYLALSKAYKSISVMNSSFSIHNAQTGVMFYRKTLRSFSSIVGLYDVDYDNRYDPKVIYDPEADRFICVMLNGTNSYNWIIIAFSQTNNPEGNWNFYKLYGNFENDTTWFDYPSIALTSKEFFLTGNKIRFNTSWQAGFSETLVYQIDKARGYNGDTSLTYQIWDNIGFNGKPIRNLFPVKGGGSIKGPEQYFLSNRNFDVQNDTIFLVKVPDTIGSMNSTLSVTPLISPLPYGVPPTGRQPDTGATLATNDGRVLGAYREGNEIQFVSTTIDTSTGSSAVYHGIISDFTTSPVIQANYVTIDSLDLGYPNLSYTGLYNGKNSSIISFNYTGPNTFPGMGAIYFDGTQQSAMLSIKSGVNSIKRLIGKEQRWGDYMGSQPDWNEIGNVWVVGIFGRNDKNYGNYMAQLTSPHYTNIPGVNTAASASALYPNPAIQFIQLDFTLAQEARLNFSIYDVQGKRIDALLDRTCRKGSNLIQFNIGSLPAGVYFLKALDKEGKEAIIKRFIKQ